tara:strand:- start:282 stop:488 length:207 start_codon:yes stop_codon:yes gene_type:complete
VVNRNINGKISNKALGALSKVKKYGYKKFVSRSLKKEISSKSPKIIDKEKKTKDIYINLIKKLLIKYL